MSFSEGQKYPGVTPGVIFGGITPHGWDTRVFILFLGVTPSIIYVVSHPKSDTPEKKKTVIHTLSIMLQKVKVSGWLSEW